MKMHLFTEKMLSRRDNLNLCDLFHMMTELSLCNSKLAPFFSPRLAQPLSALPVVCGKNRAS